MEVDMQTDAIEQAEKEVAGLCAAVPSCKYCCQWCPDCRKQCCAGKRAKCVWCMCVFMLLVAGAGLFIHFVLPDTETTIVDWVIFWDDPEPGPKPEPEDAVVAVSERTNENLERLLNATVHENANIERLLNLTVAG